MFYLTNVKYNNRSNNGKTNQILGFTLKSEDSIRSVEVRTTYGNLYTDKMTFLGTLEDTSRLFQKEEIFSNVSNHEDANTLLKELIRIAIAYLYCGDMDLAKDRYVPEEHLKEVQNLMKEAKY